MFFFLESFFYEFMLVVENNLDKVFNMLNNWDDFVGSLEY